MNALFVKSLYKIARVMLALHIGLQAKVVLNLKILSNFEKGVSDTTSCNSLFTIALGDFNARSLVWQTRDITTIKGTQLEFLTTVHEFHQLISQPTHLPPQTSSCSGVCPSLHWNCHHQISYCKLNLSIEYPPPYEHLVWDHNRANVEGIKKSIVSVSWDVMFNDKIVYKQVSIFNEIIENIISNFIPNKLVTFAEGPPLDEWFCKK